MELGRAVGAEGLTAGQVVDIKSEDKEVGLDVLQYIHHHKTAALLEAAVVCGAIVGGADEKTVEKLRKYALNIGLAFQVHIRGGTWREFNSGGFAWKHIIKSTVLLQCSCTHLSHMSIWPVLLQVIDDILDVTQTTEMLGKTAAKDLAVNKTTYPKLLGIEKSKEIADNLIAEAIQQLDGFEPVRAAPLVALAKFIGYRQN